MALIRKKGVSTHIQFKRVKYIPVYKDSFVPLCTMQAKTYKPVQIKGSGNILKVTTMIIAFIHKLFLPLPGRRRFFASHPETEVFKKIHDMFTGPLLH